MKRVIISRDVKFAGKHNKVVSPAPPKLVDSDSEESYSDDEFAAYPKLCRQSECDSDESSSDESEVEDENEDLFQDNLEYEDFMDEDDLEDITAAANNPRVICAMKKLETSYNPTATRILETPRSKSPELEEVSTTAEAGREEYGVSNISDVSHCLIDIANVMTNENSNDDSNPNFIEPKTFDEAWNHQDPHQRRKWLTAILKEFADMEKRKIWKKVKRSDMPSDCRCVKSKWVFKIKRDVTFCARLVACGYS